jgi:ubiquinone/menaquinone biosynthesis C-methylase UbiE
MLRDVKSRHEIFSKLSFGDVLDIGYTQEPNLLLKKPVGLDINKIKKPKNYLKTYVGDAEHMPLKDNSFDTVIAGELFEHIHNAGMFIGECFRVLRKNGILIISTPNPYYLSELIYNQFNFKKELNGDHVSIYPQRCVIRFFPKYGFKFEQTIKHGSVVPIIGVFFKGINIPFLVKNYIYVFRKP